MGKRGHRQRRLPSRGREPARHSPDRRRHRRVRQRQGHLSRRHRSGRDQQPGARLPRGGRLGSPVPPGAARRVRTRGTAEANRLAGRDRRARAGPLRHLRARGPPGRHQSQRNSCTRSDAAHRVPAAFVVDVGQHQMWAAQSLELHADQRFLTSGGMGAMGFALPAAIGAAVALDGRPVVIIAGDGGFQVNLQELETVVRNRSADQDRDPEQPVPRNGPPVPGDLLRRPLPVHGVGILGARTSPASRPPTGSAPRRSPIVTSVEAGIAEMWRDPAQPFLLEIAIDQAANAYPKLAFGRPITEMEPDAAPVAMEGT